MDYHFIPNLRKENTHEELLRKIKTVEQCDYKLIKTSKRGGITNRYTKEELLKELYQIYDLTYVRFNGFSDYDDVQRLELLERKAEYWKQQKRISKEVIQHLDSGSFAINSLESPEQRELIHKQMRADSLRTIAHYPQVQQELENAEQEIINRPKTFKKILTTILYKSNPYADGSNLSDMVIKLL